MSNVKTLRCSTRSSSGHVQVKVADNPDWLIMEGSICMSSFIAAPAANLSSVGISSELLRDGWTHQRVLFLKLRRIWTEVALLTSN